MKLLLRMKISLPISWAYLLPQQKASSGHSPDHRHLPTKEKLGKTDALLHPGSGCLVSRAGVLAQVPLTRAWPQRLNYGPAPERKNVFTPVAA